MDSEAKRLALEWIKEKFKKSTCEACGVNSWQVSDDLITPLVINNGKVALGGTSYPCVMLVCKNCANTKFFNAVVMQIEKPREANTTKQDSDKLGDANAT